MSSNTSFADAFSPGTTSTNTSQRSASTVRSRPRRLVSFTDDDENTTGRPLQSSGLSSMVSPELSALRSRGNTPSPHPSRGVSPMPMSHPSRATESPARGKTQNPSMGAFNGVENRRPRFAEPSSRSAVDFLDASWSSLQSLASSVLGSDIAHPPTNGSARTHTRKPSRPDPYMRTPSATSVPASWGPSAPSTPEIGAGTREERQAMVQAKKREALLLADTEPTWAKGSRHKRRDSGDRASHSNIDPDQDEDALAYIHHVQPTDSITGVTIRYGCQPAVFRRANGFWPSDNIQGRKTVLLPVDSCTVKGRPIPQGESRLLDANHARRSSLEDPNGSSISPAPAPEPQSSEGEAFPGAPVDAEADRLWKHESYVRIDGFPAAVEIGRVPRRALGFFPRSRRKSVSYTDSETPSLSERERTGTMSSTSSPAGPRSSQSSSVGGSRPHADSSGSRASNARPGPRHQRQRSNIQLTGPGVGTLDRDTQAPGPALDGLSKFFAQHLPNFAPAPAPPTFQTSSEYTSTANANTNGLDNLGGAVEGWVRKMTTRARAGFSDLQNGSPNRQTNGLGERMGRRGMGDLIELNDGLESMSSSGLLSDPGRQPNVNRSASSLGDGSSLRERFPSPGTSRTRTTGDRYKDD